MEALTLQAPSVPRRRWFVFALCLFFLAINVQYVIKIARTDRAINADHPSRSAIQRWIPQLVELGTGVDIWEKHNFPNPPIMGLILKPLVHLPPMACSLSWFYLKIAMAILSLHWVIKLLDPRAHPFPWWGKVLTVLLCLRPFEGDLIHGNVNLFILFLVVGALVAFCRKRDLLAGVVLGLAIACKVTPALFLPYFLWKRAWSTLAGAALGVVLFVWVVPGAILGWGENQQYLVSWYKNMVQPFAEGKVTSEAVNQSLPGFSYRMLMHKPSRIKWVGDIYTPVEYCNIVELDEKTVQWGLKGCMGLFALLVVWRCRTPITERKNWRLLAEFSVVVMGMLLFSERTWKHHGVVLLLPFAVLAYCLTALRWPPLTRWYLIGTLAVVFALITLTSTGLSESQDHLGERAQIYGAYVWAFLLLLTALLVLVRKSPESSEAASRGMSAANPAG
jgi:alpha-1,2-mannosyltransferase